jgi:hypothetical protein
LALIASGGVAQAAGVSDDAQYASRATLEAMAAAAESASSTATSEAQREAKRGEAWVLRERLRVGDFPPGDRIALSVEGHPKLSDTLTVRAGRTVMFPDLPEIALSGILRSELVDHLTRELGKYVRDPKIRAIPLMRVAVLGQVGRPGFYALPADALLSDVIMIAGGPGANADLAKSTIRRDGEEVFHDRDVSIALSNGMTLDQLDLRAGDEIVIGEKRRQNLQMLIQTVGIASSIIFALLAAGGGI